MKTSGASPPAPKAASRSAKADPFPNNQMAARELEPQERLDWLRLSRSESVGPVTFYALLRRFGSAAAALDALPRLSRPVRPMTRADAAAELAAIERLGGRMLCWGEPAYPSILAALDDAPPALTVLGRAEMLLAPMVAVVGARNASANGRRLARDLASGLGEAGIVVVSGMARGIDAAAHLGALETGSVAVVAGGADIVYPEENRGLYDALARDGAIVAELPLGTEPQARHFPRRNRIISGLALGVAVVEAAAKSGSLITARYALEQGREVFAVPGSPLDPRCRGTNDLLRNGATLVESVDDILRELSPTMGASLSERKRDHFATAAMVAAGDAELARAREKITELLSPTPVSVDEIIRQCQLSAPLVVTILLEFELAGHIGRHPGNQVFLR